MLDGEYPILELGIDIDVFPDAAQVLAPPHRGTAPLRRRKMPREMMHRLEAHRNRGTGAWIKKVREMKKKS